MLRLITLAALFGNYEVAGFYDSSPIVPMKDYKKDYRTLDCSECIQAEGKMCGKKDGSGAIAVNGSSNKGHGICCKPDNVTDPHCKDEGDYICSQPILEADNDAKWKNIMTGGKNMQLSAYCPLIQPEKCGLKGSHDIDANTKGKISLIGDTAITAKSGTIKSGQYDSCYYQLIAPEAKAGQSIQIKVTKLKDMNVYLYGGKTRAEATISVVEGNAKLEIGKSYYTTVENGGLLTALPSLDKPTTEFEFEYSVTDTPVMSDSMPMIIGIAVGVCAVLIILCAVMKIRQNKKENTVQVLAQESVDEPTSNLNGKENADDMNTIELNKADGEK